MLFFSSDIDWAPEPVIEDVIDIFDSYGQSCTFFTTHESSILKNIKDYSRFEIGIHPNFNKLLDGTNTSFKHNCAESIVDELLEVYPEARGIRSHSTTINSSLLELFHRKGLKYDSNIFLPYQKVQPFKLWNGFTRIPYNWEDDVHYLFQRSFHDLGFDNNELIILDFHPIHIFLNTDTEERYLASKPYYHDHKELMKRRNNETFGARTLLIKVLEEMKDIAKKTSVLSTLV